MSWSVTFIGKPNDIVKSLLAYTEHLDGQSKIEYESACGPLIALVKENFGNDSLILNVRASGHGYVFDGEQKQRQCTVSIREHINFEK